MKVYILVMLTIIIIAVCFNQIRCYNEDLALKMVLSYCSGKHRMSKEAIKSIVGQVYVPDDYEVKCWLSCVMKTLGILDEGIINWEQCKELSKQGLTDEEDKAKVDKIAEICQAKVPQEDKDECQLAYSAPVCKINIWKEPGLAKGNM